MPLSGAGAGLISQGMGMIGSLIGMGIQHHQNKVQWAHDLDMYNLQKQDQLDFWNMQNQYNSPAQQMQRLKDAGLNPNLVYGSPQPMGMADQIDQPAMQSTNISGNQRENVQAFTQSMAQALPMIYDLRLKSAQTNKTLEEAKTQATIRQQQASDSRLKILLANKTELENSLTKDTYDQLVKRAVLENEQSTQNIALTHQKIGSEVASKNLMQSQAQYTTDKNLREWQKNPYEISELSANIAKSWQSIAESKANIGLISANTKLTNQKYLSEQIETKIKQWIDSYQETSGISTHASPLQRLENIGMQGLESLKDYLNNFYESLFYNVQDVTKPGTKLK